MNEAIRLAIDALREREHHISCIILRTPTGGRRNALTEANLHVMLAIEKLQQAKELP